MIFSRLFYYSNIKEMLGRNIDQFLKKHKYEQLGFCEMN